MATQKTTGERKRKSYSFSLKQTDNPVIGKFIEKQTNYSETMRYLILKFCREYGVKDVSYMLNEMIYFPDYPGQIESNNSNIKQEESESIPTVTNEKIVAAKQEINIEENVTANEIVVEKDTDDESDIPSCYDT